MIRCFTLCLGILLWATTGLWAQSTYTSSNFPSAGDVFPIATATDSTLTITPASATATAWDFSGLQATNTRNDTVYAASTGASFNRFPTSDIRGPLVAGLGTAYTDVTATQIVTIGGGVELFGVSLVAPYTDPHIRQIAPLTYGDNATDQYALRYSDHVDSIPFLRQLIDSLTAGSPIPINPDSVRFILNGDEARMVDAWGTCLMPNSAVYSVLRQKVTNDFSLSIEIGSQVPFLGFTWVNLTTVTTLPFPTSGRVVQYNFLTEGIKQPVISLTMDSAETNIINIEYADSTYGAQNIAVAQLPDALPLEVYPNPAQDYLTVALPLDALPHNGAALTLVNTLGQPVWQAQAVRQETYTIPVQALPKGYYILTLKTTTNNRSVLRAVKQVVLQ